MMQAGSAQALADAAGQAVLGLCSEGPPRMTQSHTHFLRARPRGLCTANALRVPPLDSACAAAVATFGCRLSGYKPSWACCAVPLALLQGDAEFDRLVAAQWQSGAGARWSLAQGWPPLRFASWCLFNQRIAEPKHRQSLCVYTERRRRTAWSRPVRSAMHVEHSLPCVVPAHLLVVKLLPLRRLCTQRKEPVVFAASV